MFDFGVYLNATALTEPLNRFTAETVPNTFGAIGSIIVSGIVLLAVFLTIKALVIR